MQASRGTVARALLFFRMTPRHADVAFVLDDDATTEILFAAAEPHRRRSDPRVDDDGGVRTHPLPLPAVDLPVGRIVETSARR